MDDVYSKIFCGKAKSSPDLLSRFEDGTSFLENPLFQSHPHAIQIYLYLDEVQICDALGSKVFTNKLVFVYFTIGNLEMQFRTSFNQINLLAIFLNHQVDKYGLNVLLKPIIGEIKQLEQGIDIQIKGSVKKVFGTLAILTADNLASHAVGGFKIGFSKGFRKCRYCLGTDADIQAKFSDEEFVERTKESHNLQCESLETEESEYFSKLYGVTRKSVLNELLFFHVIGGNVPDVMHDWLEGVLPLIICKLLWHCIRVKKYFTFEMLNHAIQNFNYGHNEVKKKPSLIDIKHLSKQKLRQSASLLWLLGTLLRMMIGSCIPSDDPVYDCFLHSLEISRLIFKSSISEVEISLLEFIFTQRRDKFHKLVTYKELCNHKVYVLHSPVDMSVKNSLYLMKQYVVTK